MQLQKLLNRIETLKDRVKKETDSGITRAIVESGLIERLLEARRNGERFEPILQEFYATLEAEFLDEYNEIGQMAESVAISKVESVE